MKGEILNKHLIPEFQATNEALSEIDLKIASVNCLTFAFLEDRKRMIQDLIAKCEKALTKVDSLREQYAIELEMFRAKLEEQK